MNLEQKYGGVELRYWLLGGTSFALIGYTLYRRWRSTGTLTEGSGSPSLGAGITAPLPGMLVAGTGLPFPATSYDEADVQPPENLAQLIESFGGSQPTNTMEWLPVTPLANSQSPASAIAQPTHPNPFTQLTMQPNTNPYARNPYLRTKPTTSHYFPLAPTVALDLPDY